MSNEGQNQNSNQQNKSNQKKQPVRVGMMAGFAVWTLGVVCANTLISRSEYMHEATSEQKLLAFVIAIFAQFILTVGQMRLKNEFARKVFTVLDIGKNVFALMSLATPIAEHEVTRTLVTVLVATLQSFSGIITVFILSWVIACCSQYLIQSER